MAYVQFMLAHDGGARSTEQLVVVEQASRDGILDGHHSDDRRVAFDVLEHLFEGGAADELYLFALEVLVRRYVVERPDGSLYCYSFHNKKTRSPKVKRDEWVYVCL